MRKELDRWRFCEERENEEHALCRFLIGIDELRARLAPSKYPNVEITDEGYLWFNVDTPKGTVEILAFPFGFKKFNEPSIAISLPCKAEHMDLSLLSRLCQFAHNVKGAEVFAGISTHQEILSALSENEHPPLAPAWSADEVKTMTKKNVFFSYFGVIFGVSEKNVSEVEYIIAGSLSKIEEKQS